MIDASAPSDQRTRPRRSRRVLPRARAAKAGGWAIGDQLLSSGTQLLLVVAVAHRSSATVLGAVSIGVLVHGFFLGSVRALVGDVTLMRCRRAADPLEEARIGLSLAVLFGLLCSGLIAAGGGLVAGRVGHFLLLFAVAAPIVHAQDVLRSVAYARRRVHDAVVLDGVWLAVQVLLLAALLISDRATPTAIVVSWVAGAGCSLAVGWVIISPRISTSGIGRWVREDGRRGLGFLSDFVVSTGMVQVSFLILGSLLTLAEFGTFRLAFVAVSPVANLMSGVRSLNLARLADAHGDTHEAFRRARHAAPFFVLVAALYGAVVSLVPTSLGEIAFGSSWSSARSLVAVVAAGEVVRIGAFPAIDFVKVFASPGLLVRTRVVASAFLVMGLLIGGLLGGPVGAVWAMLGALVIATAVWWRSAIRNAAAP